MVQRGLVLLALLAAIAVVVLMALFRSEPAAAPKPKSSAEPLVVALSGPGTAFPATLQWGSLPLLAEALPSAPGWDIRYNATTSLARLGSKNLPLDILCEMLDEELQMRNFRTQLADGKVVSDEAAARRTVLIGLKAVLDWHRHPGVAQALGADHPGLKQLHAAVERLTRSDNVKVRADALNVHLTLKKSG